MEEATATKQSQIEEAIERLRALEAQGLHPNVLRDFQRGVLNCSERVLLGGSVFGALYWLDDEPRLAERVRKFEEEEGRVAYHVTHELTNIGELLTIFCVSEYEEEWETDEADLAHGFACCYVTNLSDEQSSEFGGIAFRVFGGGIVRTF